MTVGVCHCQVNESERERLESELEHMKGAQLLNEAEQRVKKLQRDWKRNIGKSRQDTLVIMSYVPDVSVFFGILEQMLLVYVCYCV